MWCVPYEQFCAICVCFVNIAYCFYEFIDTENHQLVDNKLDSWRAYFHMHLTAVTAERFSFRLQVRIFNHNSYILSKNFRFQFDFRSEIPIFWNLSDNALDCFKQAESPMCEIGILITPKVHYIPFRLIKTLVPIPYEIASNEDLNISYLRLRYIDDLTVQKLNNNLLF